MQANHGWRERLTVAGVPVGRLIGHDVVPDPYEDLPDGVLVADDTGTVVLVNPAAERILGVRTDGAVGRALAEVLPLTDDQGRDWWACSDPYDGLPTRTRQPAAASAARVPPAENTASSRCGDTATASVTGGAGPLGTGTTGRAAGPGSRPP